MRLGLKDHPHRTLTQLDRVPPRASLLCHGSILSRGRACALPGAVHTIEHQLGARKARTNVQPTARLHAGTEAGPWQKTEMLTGTSAWAQMLRSST
jgi:hypothetical protein